MTFFCPFLCFFSRPGREREREKCRLAWRRKNVKFSGLFRSFRSFGGVRVCGGGVTRELLLVLFDDSTATPHLSLKRTKPLNSLRLCRPGKSIVSIPAKRIFRRGTAVVGFSSNKPGKAAFESLTRVAIVGWKGRRTSQAAANRVWSLRNN